MKVNIFLLLLILVSCANRQAEGVRSEKESESQAAIAPEWMAFKTKRNDVKATIYNNIKIEADDTYIVWVSFQWADSAKASTEEIVKGVYCYSFDPKFLSVAEIANYGYDRNDNIIKEYKDKIPDWSYIIPGSGEEDIAKATEDLLKKQFPFNRDANKLYMESNHFGNLRDIDN